MHTLSSSFVLGYHGCDREIAERVVLGEQFTPSTNEYDWLGHGIYFWEANPSRGLEFAEELSRRPRAASRIKRPAVVGAIIDLGLCLDLTTGAGLAQLKIAYEALAAIARAASSKVIPANRGLRRSLDCAVVNVAREINAEQGVKIDTVKAAFIEGPPIYPEASFHEKTHIQVCVCNTDCIIGVFRVAEGSLR